MAPTATWFDNDVYILVSFCFSLFSLYLISKYWAQAKTFDRIAEKTEADSTLKSIVNVFFLLNVGRGGYKYVLYEVFVTETIAVITLFLGLFLNYNDVNQGTYTLGLNSNASIPRQGVYITTTILAALVLVFWLQQFLWGVEDKTGLWKTWSAKGKAYMDRRRAARQERVEADDDDQTLVDGDVDVGVARVGGRFP